MAVPSSGALSLLGIKRELSDNNYSSSNSHSNISLKDCSNGTVATINTGNASSDRPDGSAPHNMSEFYAYDHDLTTLTSFTGGEESNPTAACGIEEFEQTFKHDGSGAYPVANDTVYQSDGTSPVESATVAFLNASEARVFVSTNSSGVVTAAGNCR